MINSTEFGNYAAFRNGRRGKKNQIRETLTTVRIFKRSQLLEKCVFFSANSQNIQADG